MSLNGWVVITCEESVRNKTFVAVLTGRLSFMESWTKTSINDNSSCCHLSYAAIGEFNEGYIRVQHATNNSYNNSKRKHCHMSNETNGLKIITILIPLALPKYNTNTTRNEYLNNQSVCPVSNSEIVIIIPQYMVASTFPNKPEIINTSNGTMHNYVWPCFFIVIVINYLIL